jgi:peptidoglycan hydrolase-like protein with peptidoglycan-binding domain
MLYRLRWLVLILLVGGLLMACGQSEQPAPVSPAAPGLSARPTATSMPAGQPAAAVSAAAPAAYTRPLTRQNGAITQGADVMAAQRRLIELGYADFDQPTDNYGPKTEAAVSAFQQANGLVASGVVDAATWQLLFDGGASAANNAPPAPTPIPAGQPTVAEPTAAAASPEAPTAIPAPPVEGPGYHLLYVNREQDAIIEQVPNDQPQTFGLIERGATESVAFLLANPTADMVVYGLRSGESGPSRVYKQQRGGAAQHIDVLYGIPSWNFQTNQLVAQIADIAGPGAPPYQTVIYNLADGTSTPMNRIGASPRWTPANEFLFVEENNILVMNPGGGGDGLTQLPKSPADGWWEIKNVLMLPEEVVAFYGGPGEESGFNGNNRGWYRLINDQITPWIPAEGADLAALALHAQSNTLAYAATTRGGTCDLKGDVLYVRPIDSGGNIAPVDFPDVDPSLARQYNSLSWDPQHPGLLAIGLQPFECAEGQKKRDLPGIFIWEASGQNPPVRVAEGFFPVLVAQPQP